MSNRLGTHSAGHAYENFRVRLRKFTEKEITPNEFIRILNMNVDEFVALSGSLDDQEYKDNVVLNEVNKFAISSLNSSAAFTGGSHNIANLTIPVADQSGIVWVGDTDFDVSWIGASVSVIDNVGGRLYTGTVASIVSATELRLQMNQAVTPAITGANMIANVSANANADEINIGVLSYYKNIERITGIYSDLHGECLDFALAEFKGITKPSLYPYSSYRDQIIYTRAGENLYFAKGDLSGYGIRTMFFIRTPYHVTALEDLIDLRDKNFNMVQDMNLLDGIQTLKVPIPAEMQSAQQRLMAMRKAKDEELVKQLNGVE